MRIRAEWLEQLRPLTEEELRREETEFEALCLHPLVELQETLIFDYLLKAAASRDPLLAVIKPLEKIKVIRRLLNDQAVSRNIVVGMVLGLMRPEELTFFEQQAPKFSKSILNYVIERMRRNIYLLG